VFGLIGRFTGLALKKAGLVEQSHGLIQDQQQLRDEALALGIVDVAAESLKEAVADGGYVPFGGCTMGRYAKIGFF